MKSNTDAVAAEKSPGGFRNRDVDAVFQAYPGDLRTKLMFLRTLILDTAAATDGVGEVEEALKWGQPSYLTARSRSGSTIRIDQVRSEPAQYAMYFHCQTNLVATFRELYPDDFQYVGNRSIVFDVNDQIPEGALRHCISLALTYHLRKTSRRS
jgi:hypothetical protein